MFFKRLISGIILLILAFIAVYKGGYTLLSSLFLISMIGLREFYKAVKVTGAMEKLGYFLGIGYYLLLVFTVSDKYVFLASVLSMMLFMLLYVFSFPKYKTGEMMAAYFGILYVPGMLSFLFFTRQLEAGLYVVWLIFISSWMSDTCAYCVGVLIGKHPMAPTLSPKKSIEGAIGGIVGSALTGGIYGAWVTKYMGAKGGIVSMFAFIGAIGSIMSQVGDLTASGIKREHKLKDYGNLIPGHGGILDRFDSVIVTAPIIYFLASFIS